MASHGMNQATRDLQDELVELGRCLGLHAEREVSLEGGVEQYRPRLDALWSLPLSKAQHDAIKKLGARVPLVEGRVPVAAWEIEGVDASTKGMQADLANARVAGAWLAGLIVHDDLGKRALSLRHAQSLLFGTRPSIVRSIARYKALLKPVRASSANAATGATASSAKESGFGGSSDNTKSLSRVLAALGEKAGFKPVFEASALPHPSIKTKSRVDLVWTLPVPPSFVAWCERSFAEEEDAEFQFRARDTLPLLGFELENSSAKHGHGGLLNLASHVMAGVFVAGTKGTERAARAAKETYASYYPLRHVTVNGDYAK